MLGIKVLYAVFYNYCTKVYIRSCEQAFFHVCQKYAFQSGQTANYIIHIYNNMPREVKLIPDNGIFKHFFASF